MTKFLIQFENNIPAYDFCYETIKSIEYHNWLEEKEVYSYHQWTLAEIDVIKYSNWILGNYKDYIPVGSVEFVHKYMELCNIPIPGPVNIPEELFSLCVQEPYDTIQLKDWNKKEELFIKSNFEIKAKENGLTKIIPAGFWQVTKPIDILSEWRCFIFNNKLVDLKCYSGDQFEVPNINYINRCIDFYKSAPIAYTLDIGVCSSSYNFDGGTNTVIECHNFYSCGFYGFSGKYPVLMHSAWWKEYLINARIN